MPRTSKPRSTSAKQRKPSKGDTAIKHARAALLETLDLGTPGPKLVEAVKQRTKRNGRWVSNGEDLFGCIDLLALPRAPLRPHLVQVTTWTGGGGVAARRRKVSRWLTSNYGREDFVVWVLAWVKGEHFRRWVWDWDARDWREAEPLASPLTKRPAPAARG